MWFLLLPLFIYFFTACPTIFAGDSGDFITAAATLGFPHPPGYPLYTIAGFLFIHLLNLGSVAWRLNILSGIFSAATLAVLFVFLKNLTKNYLVSLVATLTLAFSYTFWEFSIVAEAFALNNLLSLLTFFLLWQFYQESADNAKYLYRAALVFGLGIAHHHLISLWAPGFLVLGVLGLRKVGFKRAFWLSVKPLVISLTTGAFWYSYLFAANLWQPLYTWGIPKGLSGFAHLFLRRSYGTLQIAKGLTTTSADRVANLKVFTLSVADNFTLVGILLAGFGVLYLFFKGRQKIKEQLFPGAGVLLTVTLLNFVLSGPFFMVYAGLPFDNLFYLGMFEKFSLMAHLLIPFWIAMGLVFVSRLAAKLKMNFSLTTALFILLPAFLLVVNFSKLNLHDNWEGYLFASDILKSLDSDAVVLLTGDTVVFNTIYLTEVERLRPDVTILFGNRANLLRQVRKLAKKNPNLKVPDPDDPNFTLSFIGNNLTRLPFYTNQPLSYEAPGENFVIIPQGFSGRYFAKDALPSNQLTIEKIKANLDSSDYLRGASFQKPWPAYLKNIRRYAASTLAINAAYVYRVSPARLGLVQRFLQKAKMVDPTLAQTYYTLALTFRRQGRCQKAENSLAAYLNLAQSAPSQFFYDLYLLQRDCFKNEEKAAQYWEIFQERQAKQKPSLPSPTVARW